ncbi:MAG: aldo/keto reductase [Thermomicrobiales bacterium]
MQKAVDLSRQRGWEPIFVALQPQYNLLCRSIEWEVLPVCRNEGLGILPWSPLRGGWLSGTYRRGMTGPPPGSRVAAAEEYGWGESWSAYNGERTWHLLDTLHAVAAEAGRAPAQVALNWLLHRPGVTAPIVGARTLAHLETALGSVGWSLDAAHVARLDDASDPGLPYPYDELADAARRR